MDAIVREDLSEDFTISLMNTRYRRVSHRISPLPIPKRKQKVNILSIDGGGVRALVTLVFLYEMEIRFQRHISTMFDIIGGSGFGALIAAALSVPSQVDPTKPKYSARDLIDFFNRNA
jgi:Patatin